MSRFNITVYNRGFRVSLLFTQDQEIMTRFCATMEVYEQRYNPRLHRVVKIFKMRYTTYVPKTMTYGIHRSLFAEFMEHLEKCRISKEAITITFIDTKEGLPGYLLLNDNVKPKDYQEPIIKYLTTPSRLYILPLQTGAGKTFISLYTCQQLQLRSAIVCGAMHVETWLKDIGWMFSNGIEETIVVRGKKGLMKVIKEAKEKALNKSIIIFTINTLRDYLTEYQDKGKSTYGCEPTQLFELLGIGLRINDEADTNLHFQFRLDIDTNVHKTLYLSATLESNDAFINRLYFLIYPVSHRYTALAWKKYTIVSAIGYKLYDPKNVRCVGPKGYSHNLYEQWIMGNKHRIANYFNMIKFLLKKGYHEKYLPGQKALVFMTSIDMCKRFADYLKEDQVMQKYSIHDYTSEHDDKILHTHDIIISTVGKSGRGKDINGLSFALFTVAMAAKETQIQVLGRLRQIDELFPGVTPLFYTLVCVDIPKHVGYHKQRVESFRPLVKEVNNYRSHFII